MKTIRSKIMLSMLILVFVVTASLTGTYLWYFTRNIAANLADNNKLLAQEASINLDHSVEAYVRSFDQFVNSDAYAAGLTDKIMVQNAIDRYVTDEMFTSFGIYETNGTLRYSNTAGCADVITEEDVQNAVQRSEATVTEIKPIDGKDYFGVIVPIPIDQTANGGRLMAAAVICCDNIFASLDTLSENTSNIAYIINSEGLILDTTGATNAKIGQKPVELAKTDKNYKTIANCFQNALNGQTGSYNYKINGTRYTAGYFPDTHFNLMVIVSTPTASGLFEFGAHSVQLIIIFVIVLIAATIVFALLFARSISKPIVSSTNRLRALSNGDIS
ncbi:MAG: cache domain-containing protein, partial [Ruminococcus sp.]|nr:cache domain-containing protein [Ruminococcus sp.]